MPKKQSDNKEKQQHNGIDNSNEFSFENYKSQAHNKFKDLKGNMMENPIIIGWSSLILGSILLLYSFGFFSFLNYVIAIVAGMFIIYGAYKVNIIYKVTNLIKKISAYFSNPNNKSKE